MKRILQGIKNTTFQLWFILFVLLCLGIAACLILRSEPTILGISPDSIWFERLFILALVLTGGLLLFIIIFLLRHICLVKTLTTRLNSSHLEIKPILYSIEVRQNPRPLPAFGI